MGRTTTRCRTIHYRGRNFRPVFWLFIGETHSFRMWLCSSTDSSVTLHRRQQMKLIFPRLARPLSVHRKHFSSQNFTKKNRKKEKNPRKIDVTRYQSVVHFHICPLAS